VNQGCDGDLPWPHPNCAILNFVTFQTVAENLRESFRIIAASRDVGEVRELPGVSIASAGVAFQMFNAAFLSGPVETEAALARSILMCSLQFNTRGLEWSFWVCDDWLAAKARRRSREVFEKHGLRRTTELPGLVAERILPPVRPLPSLDVRRVRDARTGEDFRGIGSFCFHVPIPWFNEVFDHASVWDRFAAYVGYVDEVPVATTAIVASGGGDVIGVYNVATVPDHRRHGYGEAIMRHALAEAERERPARPVVLQSTEDGLRLYERMGFRTVARFSVYAS
jgi:ribosomal protein S18 acetylase RimI-like enzyme